MKTGDDGRRKKDDASQPTRPADMAAMSAWEKPAITSA